MGYPWREGIVGKKQTAGVTNKWEMKQAPGVPRSLGVERGKKAGPIVEGKVKTGEGFFFFTGLFFSWGDSITFGG